MAAKKAENGQNVKISHARNVRNAVLGYNEKVVDQKVGQNIDADVLIADSFGIVCSALWPEYPGWLTIVREKH